MSNRDGNENEKTVGELSSAVLRTISNTDAPVPPPEAGNDNFDPPDRGLRAWSQVVAVLLLNGMCWGYPSAFGVYQLYYVDALGLPAAQISWIGSVQLLLTFGLCTISGRLADAGYTRICVAVGCFLAVLGTFMISLATEYWQILLAQGVCIGIGLGMVFMPAMTTVASYFKKNRGFALAMAATGTSVGSLIFPSIVQYLIPQIGFPWAVRCAGFVALTMCIIANLLLRPYLPPRRTGSLVEWQAFRELPYVFFALGAFLNHYLLFFGFFYVNSFARDVIGLSNVEAVGALLIVSGMGIPVRPIVGYLGDNYIGPINVYIIGLTCLSAVTFAWTAVKTRTSLYIFCVFFGMTIGCAQGIFVGALASLTKDPQKMGTRYGMVTTLIGFATLAGPPTGGAIIGQSGGKYVWAQVWGGFVALLAAMAVAVARLNMTGMRLRAKA